MLQHISSNFVRIAIQLLIMAIYEQLLNNLLL